MLDNAPAAKDGYAAQRLREMHDGWHARLPEGWHKGWDWLLDWDTAQLIAVMGYCLATTVDGASRDALKLKKADAAELAESQILHTRWVPDCLLPVAAIIALPESDAVTATDADAEATANTSESDNIAV